MKVITLEKPRVCVRLSVRFSSRTFVFIEIHHNYTICTYDKNMMIITSHNALVCWIQGKQIKNTLPFNDVM